MPPYLPVEYHWVLTFKLTHSKYFCMYICENMQRISFGPLYLVVSHAIENHFKSIEWMHVGCRVEHLCKMPTAMPHTYTHTPRTCRHFALKPE